MSPTTIETSTEGRVLTIRLNRPERMNAVNEEMYGEIRAALDGVRADPEVRCLILTGSVLRRDGGERQAFCAGADLKRHATGERTPARRREYIRIAQDAARSIYEFPKPVIAVVNGPARGAGTEIALCCDFILMAEDATLALPEVGLGTFVGGGATHVLPRIVGLVRARDLIYTGRVIDGPAAVDSGLALACHPLERLHDEARSLARELASKAPASLAFAKKTLRQGPLQDIATAMRVEMEAILACMNSEDWHEGLRAFAEKRKPRFTGR